MDFNSLLNGMRNTFKSGRTRSLEWRKSNLEALLNLLTENEKELCVALEEDMHKPKQEAFIMEINFVKNEIVHAINNLSYWMNPEKVRKNMLTMMDSATIIREPYGVAFIIGAWNYPIQLSLGPLVGAIAAGNCALVKPSEVSQATSAALVKLAPKYFDNQSIAVIAGGVSETQALLQLKFDYIFYTGSSVVGKIIAEAAAKHLTPVTLELGGKSPVYVDSSADLNITAHRIAWGKFVNAGQTCIAPDYVLCTKEIQDKLIPLLQQTLIEFYGQDPKDSPDYCRIINDRHFNRLMNIHTKDKDKVAVGGDSEAKTNYIEPTLLKNVTLDDACMKEEIFGPILPFVTVEDPDEAIDTIWKLVEKPLSFYIFSKNQNVIDKLITGVSSGGVCVNDTLLHASLNTLPFGGVGNSGCGGYHGWFSFDTFSHRRACLHKDFGMEKLNGIRYPPYADNKLGWVSWLTTEKQRQGRFCAIS